MLSCEPFELLQIIRSSSQIDMTPALNDGLQKPTALREEQFRNVLALIARISKVKYMGCADPVR